MYDAHPVRHASGTTRGAAPRAIGADPGELSEVLQFMRLLWAVDHGLQRTSKRMNRDLGVTGPQRLVIRVVGRFPGISAGQLAAMLHVHPSTLTGVLARLIRRRLLTRAPHLVDRRRTVLRLTSEGRRLDRLHAGTVESAVRQALRRASSADRAAAGRLLARIAGALEQG
jgi:DNA-binding MarR family transcriptional regulator